MGRRDVRPGSRVVLTGPTFPRRGNLFAADPALRSPGAAYFRDGVLRAADRIKVPAAVHKLPIGARCARVASLYADWAGPLRRPNIETRLVVEWPMIYPGRRAKGGANGRQVRPNDVVNLAGSAGAIVGALAGDVLEVTSPHPADWSGQVSKEVDGDTAWDSPRGRWIRSCLTSEELAVVPAQLDAIDAVGLGLWALGRLPAVLRRARPGDPGVVLRHG